MKTLKILLLCMLAAAVRAGETNGVFSVMTFNILRPAWSYPTDPPWSNRVGGIAQIIRSRNPCIVALQEENDAMVQDMLKLLPDYDYTFPVQPNGAGLLFCRAGWKPVHLDRRLTVDGRWITEARMEQSGGKQLYVYCLHLSPFEEWKQMMGAEILRQMIDARQFKEVPVVVMGDMNAPDTSEPFKRLTEGRGNRRPLSDSFAALHPGETAGFTADSYKTKGRGTDFRIDYILFSEGLTPVHQTTVHDKPDGFYPSDHLPVYAEFGW
jgi:endonuclease/exonuclease/phosphatase family metal-dependent hydrolase